MTDVSLRRDVHCLLTLFSLCLYPVWPLLSFLALSTMYDFDGWSIYRIYTDYF